MKTKLARFAQINRKPDRQPRSRHGNDRGRTMNYARSFLRALLATLREIFDENAYQRFLLRTDNTASVQSYREFQREQEAGMTNRPRCC